MKIIITESQRDSILGYRGLTAFMNQAKDSYHTFAKVLDRLANQPGNPYTDYSDIDENLKMKYFSPDPRGVEIFLDIENLGHSEIPNVMYNNQLGRDYGDVFETNDNKYKYKFKYVENDEIRDNYKEQVRKRLQSLLQLLDITDLSLHIYP